jgi:hypothetical protein
VCLSAFCTLVCSMRQYLELPHIESLRVEHLSSLANYAFSEWATLIRSDRLCERCHPNQHKAQCA